MTSLSLFDEIAWVFDVSWHLIRDRLRSKLERQNEKKRMEEIERATKRKEKNAAKRARKRKNKVSLAPISIEWQENLKYKQCPVGLFQASTYLEHKAKLGNDKQVEETLEYNKAAFVNKSDEVEVKIEMAAAETANKRKFQENQKAAHDVKDYDEWDSRLDDFSASNTSVIDNPLEYTNKELKRVKMDSIAQRNAVILKNILKDCGATSLQDIVQAVTQKLETNGDVMERLYIGKFYNGLGVYLDGHNWDPGTNKLEVLEF